MPKSKRNKVVALTKVKKQGRDAKTKLIDSVQEAVSEFEHTYVINFQNMKSQSFRAMQQKEFPGSK
jgi:mRNA turnover protein 4